MVEWWDWFDWFNSAHPELDDRPWPWSTSASQYNPTHTIQSILKEEYKRNSDVKRISKKISHKFPIVMVILLQTHDWLKTYAGGGAMLLLTWLCLCRSPFLFVLQAMQFFWLTGSEYLMQRRSYFKISPTRTCMRFSLLWWRFIDGFIILCCCLLLFEWMSRR